MLSTKLPKAADGHIVLKVIKESVFPLDKTVRLEDDVYILTSPLIRGYVLLETNGRRLHDGAVRPGMIRVASPGEAVRTHVQTPYHCVSLTFTGPALRERLSLEGHRPGQDAFIEPLLQPSSAVASLCRGLIAGQDTLRADQLLTDSVAHALIACVLHTKNRHGRKRSRATQELGRAEIQLCKDFALAHLCSGIDLSDWAKQLSMTPVEFTRRFQSSMHDSPYLWFQKLRIERARQLLRTTQLSLAQIALDVGFCSQSHFTLTFRKLAGCPPGEWRQTNSSTSIIASTSL